MPLNQHFSAAVRNLALAAILAQFNSGYIRIYAGTQPADTTGAAGTLLAELRFASTAFGAPASGSATANTIPQITAGATGVASWFRCFASDGTTVLCDGSVGSTTALGGGSQVANMLLGTINISAGGAVNLNSFVLPIAA